MLIRNLKSFFFIQNARVENNHRFIYIVLFRSSDFWFTLGAFEILQWMYHADKLHRRVALYSRSSVNHLKMVIRKCFRTCYETTLQRSGEHCTQRNRHG